MHFEDGVLFAEPGIELDELDSAARIVRFGAPNLFFGGVQAALRSVRTSPARGIPAAAASRYADESRARAVCARCDDLLLGGCGVSPADLFLVTRTGTTPGAQLTSAHRRRRWRDLQRSPRSPELDDTQIVKAREIQEELLKPSAAHLSLPPRPGSTLSYGVRDESGTVSFADNSAAQPTVLHKLQLFVLHTAQQICHLSE